MIYLDYQATTPLDPTVRDAMLPFLGEIWGNPSSVHHVGRKSRALLDDARYRAAKFLGAKPSEIIFTSGGTEANALGVLGLAAVAERRGLPRVVAASGIDHPSLRGAVATLVARGWVHRPLAVSPGGRVEVDAQAVPGVGVVALAVVNHELGTLMMDSAIEAARAAGALIHLDAVQAGGKLAVSALAADALAVSAHKIGGPQGIGALAVSLDDGLPLIEAGHQERGRRPGTENVLGIVGFGAAAEVADPTAWPGVAALGAQLEDGLRRLGDVRIHGADAPRIGGTINAGFAGARGESIVIALDLAGIAASTGAACTSGSVQPSPVLLGLGLSPAQAREAVRFSLGRTTTADEIAAVLARLPAILARARGQRASGSASV